MSWLDIGIESTISYSQICPGWVQESNLKLVVYRYALAEYRYRVTAPFMQRGSVSVLVVTLQ